MRHNKLLAALLLMLAGLQTAWGQGFRVYKSDGTVAQYSLHTDSIVFYDGIGTDEDFGPFTPVNQCIAGTWYKTKYETVTFNEDGTTDYIEGATYKFLPYQGTIVIYNASGAPTNILKAHDVTAESMILSTLGSETFNVWTRTKPVYLVTSITLSETKVTLQPDGTTLLTATVLPADADNPSVIWTSSNEAVAEVYNNGMVTAKANGTCIITCSARDGSGVKAECKVRVKMPDTIQAMDLGLPSGTLWATCNIGASSMEECGDYFAWGETEPKEEYGWIDKEDDGLTELLPENDAATANWGNDWQMPSREQIEELRDYTTMIWVTGSNGVNGKLLISKLNGASIFLPAAGFRYEANFDDAGSAGNYWSRSLSTDGSNLAYALSFSSGYFNRISANRYRGQSVRPVYRLKFPH